MNNEGEYLEQVRRGIASLFLGIIQVHDCAVNFLLPFSHDPDENISTGNLDQDSNLSNCFAFFSIALFKI